MGRRAGGERSRDLGAREGKVSRVWSTGCVESEPEVRRAVPKGASKACGWVREKTGLGSGDGGQEPFIRECLPFEMLGVLQTECWRLPYPHVEALTLKGWPLGVMRFR